MEELQQKAGKEKLEVEAPEIDEGLVERDPLLARARLDEAIATEGKLER